MAARAKEVALAEEAGSCGTMEDEAEEAKEEQRFVK